MVQEELANCGELTHFLLIGKVARPQVHLSHKVVVIEGEKEKVKRVQDVLALYLVFPENLGVKGE